MHVILSVCICLEGCLRTSSAFAFQQRGLRKSHACKNICGCALWSGVVCMKRWVSSSSRCASITTSQLCGPAVYRDRCRWTDRYCSLSVLLVGGWKPYQRVWVGIISSRDSLQPKTRSVGPSQQLMVYVRKYSRGSYRFRRRLLHLTFLRQSRGFGWVKVL